MPAQCPLTSSLALLVLLGTARAGPFSPRSNVTLSAPRPPPQPGGRTAVTGRGNPSSQLYEHTVEGGEKQVVFTHRINLPPSASCGCPPGTEPPAPASEVQALRIRLEILEELVKGLKEQCTGGCCPTAAQAGTGQTDVRSLCSLHGVFDLSRCACSCEPGWGGPTCSDPTDATVPSSSSSPSASESCPDDCNDQGRCVRGRCVCFPGYTGPSCGWPSCPGDCQGHGRCVKGVCVCRFGFSGDDCSQRTCPRGCSQRGRCEDGRCVCDAGYIGEDCGVKNCPRGCSQRGRCENGRCVCDPGYTGEDCGARSCTWDCGEGGRCVDGRCVCWPGYAGEDCSTRTCPRDCRGRGRCEDGECICDAGYSGDDCGVRSCPGDCNQRGHCEDGRCVCWPGYTGPDCGARACPRDCRGRGLCENGLCVCNAGYSGDDCGVRSCPGDCRGRGRCESGRCVCWPGYTGRDCGIRACPGDCRGRGRCMDGRCVCNPGFIGEDCGSRRCPGDCHGRGRCEDGVCVCNAGYEGEDCGALSCPGGCRGRGQCQNGRCVCDGGYEGKDCGVRQCPGDCNQRGVCQDGVCTCWEGYAGEDCGLRTCPANCHRRGRCEDGSCVCDAGYTGPTCATRTCPADCRGRGRCVQGVCLCHAGYSGEDCGQEEPPSSACPGGCGPRALCRAGQCVCVEGFRGPDCAIQTCPGDCRGRGECHEGRCDCQDGFAGEDCGEEVPAVEGMRMHLLEETTVRTEWTRAAGPVDAYEIQFIPTTEGVNPPFTARVPSSASAYDQRGLAPGQEYQVTVRALRGTSWGPPASKTITTMIDGPQDLRVVAVMPTTLELSWLRPLAEVDRFVVSYVSAGNQRVRLEVPPKADGTLLTDLMPDVEYVVTVTAERGPAVSYPTSVRANTAPGHYDYSEVRPPAPPPKPHPRPTLRPPRPPRPPRPAKEEEREEPRPGLSLSQPPRRAWANLTAELGRYGGTVEDVERHLRAHRYPLRANQTYPSVARYIYTYLQRHLAAASPAGSPAAPPHSPHPTASPDPGTWKRDSNRSIYSPSPEGVDRVAAPRHPKPEVLGTSADGALLVSLDGLRGQFERVVMRWRPQPPAEGPGGELTVPGSTRAVSLPDLRLGTTYHVEVHGVRAGQTSKSYAFITTTGFSPSRLLGATDEPPPSGPSTTQGARAPVLQQRPQELAELRVLGRDKTGRLRVAWTAQPDIFAHFQLHLRVPQGLEDHEELLPGDTHQALVPPPLPGSPYELLLHGIHPDGQLSAPLIYQGIMDKDGEKPEPSLVQPRLGELTVTDVSPNSLLLHWTVPEGTFESFVIQYKDRDGPQVVPVKGPQRSCLITSLDPGRKYKFVLYGLVGKKRHGPLVTEAKTMPWSDPGPGSLPRLGKLWVTDPTSDSLRLSWTVPEGQFDSFMVQYRNRDGQPQVVPVEGPERSIIISSLDPDHKYKFTLFGIANKKRHGPLTADGTTAPGRKEEPPRPESPVQPLLGELTVTGVTPDSLRLSWTVAQGPFDSFVVQYKDAKGQPKAVPVGRDENEVTIPGLESERKYKMNLYGLQGRQRVGPVSVVATTAAFSDVTEETAASTEVDETPAPTEPSTEAPEELLLGELTVTGSTSDSLSLSWTVPQGHFDAFTVQYKDRDGRPQVVRVGGKEREVTVQGLEPGHKYKMHLYGLHTGRRVGPVSTLGLTAPQQEEEAPPATEPPQERHLGELTVTDVTPTSVGLSWTVPEGEFDSFMVQYKDSNGQLQAVAVAADQREVTIPSLEPSRKYKINFYGIHDGQRMGPLSVVAMTAPLPPAPATNAPERPQETRLGKLAVTGMNSNSIDLSWTVPEGKFDSFVVQYKDRDGQPQVVPVAADEHEVTVPDLEPSRKYKFLLFGIQDGKRQGPVSVEAKTDASSSGTLPHLGELWVMDPTPDSLRLSWTVPEGHFDSFTVQFKDRDGPRVVSVEGHQRSVTVTPLDPGRKYRFLLYGLLDKKRHGPLTADGTTETQRAVDETVTKHPPKPRLGEELQVTRVTPDSVGLSWMVPEGEFDSFVVQYKDRDRQPQVVPVEGSLREVTIPGLDPARKYKLLLYGLHGDRRVGPISAIAWTNSSPMSLVSEPAPREEDRGVIQATAPTAAEPRLGMLTVVKATSHTLHLSWMVTEGEFDSFMVEYTDRDGLLQAVSLEGDQNDVTISGLKSDHRYLVDLYGFHDGQRVGPAHTEALTVPQEDEPSESPTATPKPLFKPHLRELTVTDATPDSLHLSWTVPEGHFDHFLIQYRNGDGQPKAVRVPGHEDEVTISGLEPDQKYKMNLYGLHGGQRVGPVSVIGVTAPEEETTTSTEVEETLTPTEPSTEAPESPKDPLLGDLTVTGSTSDSLSLSWTIPQGRFDAFTVQYKDRDRRPQAVRVRGEELKVTVQGLEPGRKYKMHLYGFHAGRRVGPVSTVGLTAPVEEPSTPAAPAPTAMLSFPKPRLGELTVTDATPDSLHLSWTVPEGHFDHFLVQYRNGDGQPKAVRVPGHKNEVTISDLEPDHKYKMNLYGLHGGQRVGPVSVIRVTGKEEEMTPAPTVPSTETPEPPIKPRLGELTVTDATPDSLHLSWIVPEGHFDHFLVQYRNGDGQPEVVRVPGHEDEVTISGLEPDHKYKMNLYGLHGGQRVGPISVIWMTAPEEKTPIPTEASTEAPEAPKEPLLGELMVTGSSTDSLSLSWTIPQGHFDAFTVQYKDRDGRPQVVRVRGEEREVTMQGLEPGRKYKMHLYGLHMGRRVGPVSTVGLTVPQKVMEETPTPTEPITEAPEPPKEPLLGELTVTGSTTDSLSLSWTVPQGRFDTFTLQYKDRDGQPQAVRVGGKERKVTVQGLEPGHKYKMHLYGLHVGRHVGPVSAVGLTENEVRTTPAMPTAVSEPPFKPRLGELTVTDATPDSLHLSWTVPEGHFDHFLVQYRNGDGQPKAVRVPGHKDEVTISGLESDHKYKMNLYGFHGGQRVGPVSAIGVTAPEEETPTPTEVEETLTPTEPSTEVPESPEEPLLGELKVIGSTSDSLSLSWTIPQGHFDAFTVQYKDRDGRPQAVHVGGEELEVTVQGLEPGHKYKMHLYGLHTGQRVGPVSAVGFTEDEVSTTPATLMAAPEPPFKPHLVELTVTDATPNSLLLSWTVPEGHFDHFLVQYRNGDGQPKAVRVPGHEDEVTISGLEPDHKYKMNLYGLHGGQRVGPVSITGVTAPEEETLNPTEVEEIPTPTEPSTEAPEAPERPLLGELTVTGSTSDSLSLSWTVPRGRFNAFTMQYKDRDGRPQVVRVRGEEREVTVQGLEPGHKYKMHLYGLHPGRRVGPVSAVGFTEDEVRMTPATPTAVSEPPFRPRLGELMVTDTTPDSLHLSWTVPEGHFDHFLVQYRNGDGQPKAVRVPGHKDEVTISGLEPDHKYKMNLYGLHGGQRVGPISVTGVTAPEEETPNPTEVEEIPTPTEPSTEAPESTEKALLGELTVTGSTSDSLSLSWTIPRGRFNAFTMQYKDRDGRPQVVRVRGEEREVTVQGLEPGHKYKMHLYGLHPGRRVGPVSAVGFTATPMATPKPSFKPRLGELTVTDATPNSLHVSWTVPEGHFDHFLVQYKKGDGQPKGVWVPGHEDEVTISGLEPDHKYKMNLYGLHGGQRVGPISITGVTAPEEETPTPTEVEETLTPTELSTEAPEPPEEPLLGELTVTGSTSNSLSLSWTIPQGRFDAFTMQYKDRDGRPQVVRVRGEECKVTVQGLEPGHKYKMHLYGLHAGRRVGPVSAVGLTEDEIRTTPATPTAAPEPPFKPRLGELTVTDTTPDSLRLSWIVPEGHFDHFLVQYRNGDGQPKAVRVPGHENEVTVSGLEPDQKYKMNLYGLHGGQRVGPVSVIGVTAPEEDTPTSTEMEEISAPTEVDETPTPTEPSTEAPEPPEEPLLGKLTVTGSSTDSLSLSWTVPQGHFDTFTVQYKHRDRQPQAVRVRGEERKVTVQGLEPGHKYKMHLYGVHMGRRVGPVSAVGTTVPLPTEPLKEPRLGELSVAAVTLDTVHLSWTVAQGPFDSFQVQYRDAQGQLQVVPAGGELREVTVLGLEAARKYKFLLFGLQDGKRRGPVSVEAKTVPDVKTSPRLGELTVTDVTPDSVGLSWTVPEGEFDSFMVQYKDKDGQPKVVPVAANQREVTIPSLEPNRKYKFLLYGLAGRKRLGPVSADGTTAPLKEEQPPPRLRELTVTDETPDSLRLLWTVAQGSFDSFVVQYRDTDGQPQVVSVAGDQREVTVEGLEPDRKYKLLLYGLLGGKHLGPVSVLGVTAPEEDMAATLHPDTEAPEPPKEPRLGALAVTDVTPDSLHLSWTVAQGPFDSFVVQYQDADGQPQALLVGNNQHKVLVSGLDPSTSYKFFLYGLHEGTRLGPISAEATTGQAPAGQTPGEPGPRLSQLSVSDMTTSSLRLNWEAPPEAFDSFLLRFGVPSPSTLEPRSRPLLQREQTVPGALRSAVLRDLRPGTLYSLTLYGLRGPHKADSIQGSARTLNPVLESPHDLQFSDIRETSAKVNWMPPPSRVDGFKVSYQLADGGEPQSVQVDSRARTQKLQGLIPGARYEVTVVSVRGFEESEPLTGFLTTVPDGPTQLLALNLTEGSALLHWKPPQAPVDKYNVRVTAPGAPPRQASAPGSAVDYPLYDLVLHTNYTATVRGLRGPNLTSPASITFTTGLEAPQDLEAKEVTPRTALLTWTEPQVPPTGYLLRFDTPGGQTQEILLPGGITSHQLQGLFPATPYSAQLRAVWGQSFSPPVSTTFTTGGLQIPFPRDCGEEMQNGAGTSRTTTIFLNGNREQPLNVFCDMETDGGGWLVFQRRMDGQTDFWRDWEDYAHGFGNTSGEFWLGNDALHSLTQTGDYSMRVDLRAGDEAVFAQYDSFQVDSAAEYYRLHLEGYHGTAGDSMSYHSGSVFSTRDRDPNNLLISCAVSYRGAWWYRNCHYANLNGLYGSTVDHQGVSWFHWKGFDFSVPFTEMKLRPRSYRPLTRGG
ncbi:tenascin-X [Dugong dugon]